MHGGTDYRDLMKTKKPDPDTGNGVEKNNKTGDGLVLYEEYRGFYVAGEHTRLSPTQKDVK
jgi:hypothetical protein